MLEIFKNRFFTISKLDDRLYFAKLNDVEGVTVEEVIQFVDSMDAVTQREHHVSIFDISGALEYLVKGRDYLVKTEMEHNRNVIAAALISKNRMARVAADLIISVNTPKFPLKMFGELKEAESWARERLNEFKIAEEKPDSANNISPAE